MRMTQEQRLEHIISRMQGDTAVDAPAETMQYVKNLFRVRMPESKSVLERVLAMIKIDLAPNRAAFGERSAGEGQARQLLFEAGENAVDLRIKAADEKFDIRGQILGGGFENAAIEITGQVGTFAATTSDTSEFKLTGVPAGIYAMTISSDDTELVVEELTIS
ncbi:MAG: hypothetical protein ABIV21_05775 [Pyrinomonadaceae bacterium]